MQPFPTVKASYTSSDRGSGGIHGAVCVCACVRSCVHPSVYVTQEEMLDARTTVQVCASAWEHGARQ